MTTAKATKRALISSILALFLCFTMLLGTTYAWFTDSVISKNNVIHSGTLDVALEYKQNWSDEWATVNENTKIFKDGVLYEPGYTEVVYLRVSNAGTLALKYLLSLHIANEGESVNVYGEKFKLSDYLKVGTYVMDEYSSDVNLAETQMPAMFGTREAALRNVALEPLSTANAVIRDNTPLLAGDKTAQVIAIVLTLPDTGDNEANTMPGEKAPYIELGARLYATQYTHENDSFDDQYDADVDKPQMHVIVNADDFSKAFREGGIGRIENMNLTDAFGELADGKDLVLNTNNSVITKKAEEDYLIVNRGDLEITGDGTIKSEFKGSIQNWGTLYVNRLKIEVSGDRYGFHCMGGTAEINELDVTSERGGLNLQGGKITVNSGSIKFGGYYDNAAKKWRNGQCVYAVGEGTEVVINGGDFRFTGGVGGSQRILCAQDGAIITVNGGTFGKGNAKASATWLWEYDSTPNNGVDNAGTIIVKGGSFQFDPSAFVAEGYEAVKGEDGWWTVSAK